MKYSNLKSSKSSKLTFHKSNKLSDSSILSSRSKPAQTLSQAILMNPRCIESNKLSLVNCKLLEIDRVDS